MTSEITYSYSGIRSTQYSPAKVPYQSSDKISFFILSTPLEEDYLEGLTQLSFVVEEG